MRLHRSITRILAADTVTDIGSVKLWLVGLGGTTRAASVARVFCFQLPENIYNAGMQKLESQFNTFLRKQPTIGKNVYLAKTAVVLGDVTLGDHSSVWYGAVLRGDINKIVVGHHSNIQDNSVLHLADDYPCIVGSWVTVGHSAVVHACTVGDEVLIGMGATILDGTKIGDRCLIGSLQIRQFSNQRRRPVRRAPQSEDGHEGQRGPHPGRPLQPAGKNGGERNCGVRLSLCPTLRFFDPEPDEQRHESGGDADEKEQPPARSFEQ